MDPRAFTLVTVGALLMSDYGCNYICLADPTVSDALWGQSRPKDRSRVPMHIHLHAFCTQRESSTTLSLSASPKTDDGCHYA